MEFEFDKEIDAILRKVRENQAVFAANVSETHLDADTLSAFAENALPEKSKKLYTAHLADCDRCRRILSNLISLNSEEEIVPVKSAETPLVETAIPWYRKLFFGRNLVYTMGALVIVFTTFTGFIIFQNNSSQNAEVSKVSESKSAAKGRPNAAEEPVFSANTAVTAPSNTAAMSNSASVATNTTTNTASNISTSSMNTAVNPMSNSSSTVVSKSEAKGNLSDRNVLGGEEPARANELRKQDRDDVFADKEERKPEPIEPPKTAAAAPAPPPKPVTDKKDRAEEEKVLTTRNADENGASGISKAKKMSSNKNVGGKTFRYENSVWIDSAYRQGMPITNVSRSSNEYKNLDGGLRNIAEQFNQTVVVVWKRKAYQIR